MHDRNGTPLALGDIVTVQAKITSILPTDAGGYCNVTVEYGYDKPHEAYNMRGSISAINTRQLLLVEKGSVRAEDIGGVPG